MENQPSTNVPTLRFNPLSLDLVQGDILHTKAEAFCCAVDDRYTSSDGIFGLLVKQGNLSNHLFQGKRLFPGSVGVFPLQGLEVPRVFLISIFNAQLGTVDRNMVKKGFVEAMKMADNLKLNVLATSLLGHVKSRVDYEVISGYLIRAVQEFASSSPSSLQKVLIYTFNPTAFRACQNQFFTYDQSMQ